MTNPVFVAAQIAVCKLSPPKVPNVIFPKRSTTTTSLGCSISITRCGNPLAMPFAARLLVGHLAHIGPQRHVLRGDGAAHPTVSPDATSANLLRTDCCNRPRVRVVQISSELNSRILSSNSSGTRGRPSSKAACMGFSSCI